MSDTEVWVVAYGFLAAIFAVGGVVGAVLVLLLRYA
jgi:hypothetical protein